MCCSIHSFLLHYYTCLQLMHIILCIDALIILYRYDACMYQLQAQEYKVCSLCTIIIVHIISYHVTCTTKQLCLHACVYSLGMFEHCCADGNKICNVVCVSSNGPGHFQ